MSDDALTILYGGSGETVSPEVPDWRKAETASAAARLAGKGEGGGSDAPPADDLAKTLYGDAAGHFDDREANSFFHYLTKNALDDGDKERAGELGSAQTNLIADMKAAGTPDTDFSSALNTVGEYMSRDFSDEERASTEASSMVELQSQYGDDLGKNLAAARQLIADLNTVSPGLIDTLERSGAGNDKRLVQLAIGEAKRRGYLK